MLLANLLRRRCCSSLPLLLGSVVVLWFCSSPHVAATGSKVEHLPGVRPEGPLPFELETGYIGVGELEDIQLFYYFVKSESNPNIDPIVLWISGGPECSSFVAMTEEFGPLLFDVPKNNWSLPTLSLNPYSWTKVASFIFLDLPVRTGFSYAKSSKNYTATDVETSYHAAEFIRKWLEDHFQYQSNAFYVGGDSYSGITVPMIVQAISYGIDAKFKPLVNLKFDTVFTGKHYYWPDVIGEENDAKRFRGYNVHAFDRHLIFKGCGEKWVKCRIPVHYEITVHDTRPYHANLSTKGYISLIYSGNADMFVSSFSTERWTKSLNYSVNDDWRPWLINNRIVGEEGMLDSLVIYSATFADGINDAKNMVMGGSNLDLAADKAERKQTEGAVESGLNDFWGGRIEGEDEGLQDEIY
nr:serine carboxypeptidase-like 11 [Ipomoea batatas]